MMIGVGTVAAPGLHKPLNGGYFVLRWNGFSSMAASDDLHHPGSLQDLHLLL
jgi:hypothetical protein